MLLKSKLLYPLPLSQCTVYPATIDNKVYMGETTRRLEQRGKELQDACKRGDEQGSAIA